MASVKTLKLTVEECLTLRQLAGRTSVQYDRQTRRKFVHIVTALEEVSTPYFKERTAREESLTKVLEAFNEEWTVTTDKKDSNGQPIVELKDGLKALDHELAQKKIGDEYYADIKAMEQKEVEIPYTDNQLKAFIAYVWDPSMPDSDAMADKNRRNAAIKETLIADALDLKFLKLYPDETDSTDRA